MFFFLFKVAKGMFVAFFMVAYLLFWKVDLINTEVENRKMN